LYKLKKLELLGFKSFADRSRLEFADGVAAVVGPNGCGKSNISDAITWVLGEQSARSLRGERMSDVIFNGTGKRPPTGMAEVSMTLINPEYNEAGLPEEIEAIPEIESVTGEAAAFDAETAGNGNGHGNGNGNGNGNGHGPEPKPRKIHPRSGEITVTRRLFRSGESEYLINGDICRLRDIQDLFMGTGLGPESYAIIEQGRIGQILSSKPSDRRLILEEAAGVSKFKTRKRLAEAKLESARQNLSRIADILEEVTKQVGSLKRQASKARRYKELHDELRGRLKSVLTSRLKALEVEFQRLTEELAQIQETCLEAARELEVLEQEQKGATQRYETLEDQLTECRESLSQGGLERERLLSRLEQVRQQGTNLDARAEEAGRESSELQAQLTTLEQQTAERTEQVEKLRQEFTAAKDTLAEVVMRQEDLNFQLGAAEQEVESCRQSLMSVVSHAAELRNQLVQAEEAGLAVERQAARVDAEKARSEEEHSRLAAELAAYISDHQRDASTLAELADSVSQTTNDLEQARSEEVSHRTKLEALRREYSGSMARKEALEQSLARHAYSTESVRRLLSGEISAEGHQFQPMGLLADFVEVSPGYEEVVEEFLKRELECVVVGQYDQARSGIALLQTQGKGRSTFFVTHVPSSGHTHGSNDSHVRNEPGVVASIRELVRFESKLGLNGDLVLPAISSAYVVEDDAAAERLASAYPDCHFLTATGAHYHHRMVSGGKGSSAGPLALRRDFRELERHTAELEAQIRASEIALAEATTLAKRLDEQLKSLVSSKMEAEKKAVVADEKLRQVRETCERTRKQLDALLSEAAVLQSERARAEERQAALHAELETAGAARAQREDAINQATQLAREFRAGLDRLAQDIADAQSAARGLEEKTRAAEAEAGRLQAAGQDFHNRIARLAQQQEIWQQERERLGQESDAHQLRLQQLQLELETARAQLHGLEEESRTIRAQRDTLGPRVDAARGQLDARRQKRSEAEVALARAESDYNHHAQQCRDELNTDAATLLAELAPESVLAGEALQLAEEELRQLKARIESLGPVNMMALEELQEAEERLTFLDTQRQDLLSSIEDTTQAIREIDQVSRQQFLEAFKAINTYFAESFRVLFGGGIGEMRLADENDADSGIDLVAQPPGKRLQNVLLLSGGEKALVALALLIAIFRYTPSPFCVLDEVDAPLDESNVDRFTRMIQHMSHHTQFILITHSKRTMEIAKVMYGVTMEEPGVSRLVSVRFDAFEREPVAVPA
jgi:chromosome segregation protein